MTEGSDWMTPTELAERLGVNRRTVFRMIERGQLPPPRKWNARVVKWKKTEIADILNDGPKPEGTYKPAPEPDPPPASEPKRRGSRKKGG